MADAQTKIVLTADDRTKAAFDSAKRSMASLSTSAAGLTRTLGLALPALTGAGFVAMAKGAIDAADAMNDMSQRLGVSVKDLASFKLIAEQSGTSLEGVGNGIARLSRTIGEAERGNKTMAQALKDLGVTARDPKEALFQLADATQKIQDPTRRAALLSQVLGKSYGELVPLLAQGSEELKKAAKESESFAEAMAKAAPNADKFNDNLLELKRNAATLAALFVGPLAEGFNYLAQKMKTGEAGGSWDLYLKWLGEATRRQDRLNKVTAQFGKESLEYKAALDALNIAQEKLRTYQNQAAGEQAKPQLPTVNATEFACIADGGVWDGKKCVKAPKGGGSKTDPLASFFKATDTAQLKEYSTLTAELLRRMANAKGDTSIYVEALDEINKKFADVIGMAGEMKDALGTGSFFSSDPETLKFIQEQQAAINELNAMVPETTQRLQAMIEAADFSKLARDQEDMVTLADAFNKGLLTEAQYLDTVKNRLGLVAQEVDKNKSLFDKLGTVITAAASGIASDFKNADDILRDLGASVARVIAQTLILEPLINSLKKTMSGGSASSSGGLDLGSLFSTGFGNGQNLLGDFASLFGFEKGGVMTSAGPLPLKKYAFGGIANTPQLALFGEGSRPEAYVPLPDGRRIPVRIEGGGGKVINQTVNITAANPTEVRLSRGALIADFGHAMQHMRRWM